MKASTNSGARNASGGPQPQPEDSESDYVCNSLSSRRRGKLSLRFEMTGDDGHAEAARHGRAAIQGPGPIYGPGRCLLDRDGPTRRRPLGSPADTAAKSVFKSMRGMNSDRALRCCPEPSS